MEKRNSQHPPPGAKAAKVSVREIVHQARGELTQNEFVDLLRERHGITTSQGLISKYESGKANPPAAIIDICMGIIHGDNIQSDVSLNELEEKVRRVLFGPAQAEARKAFAVILDSLA